MIVNFKFSSKKPAILSYSYSNKSYSEWRHNLFLQPTTRFIKWIRFCLKQSNIFLQSIHCIVQNTKRRFDWKMGFPLQLSHSDQISLCNLSYLEFNCFWNIDKWYVWIFSKKILEDNYFCGIRFFFFFFYTDGEM